MRISYTPAAYADREEIFAYIEKLNPLGARAVKRDIVRAIRRLEHFPESAPSTDEPGVRQLIVPRRPYKVYYRIENSEVWIVHIRDARREPWLSP
jgi:toxin ParE1/3/4